MSTPPESGESRLFIERLLGQHQTKHHQGHTRGRQHSPPAGSSQSCCGDEAGAGRGRGEPHCSWAIEPFPSSTPTSSPPTPSPVEPGLALCAAARRKSRGQQPAAPRPQERVRSGRWQSQTAILEGTQGQQLTHLPLCPQSRLSNLPPPTPCHSPSPAPCWPLWRPGSRSTAGSSLMRSPRWKLRRLRSSVM